MSIEPHRISLEGKSGKRYSFYAQPMSYLIEREPGVLLVTQAKPDGSSYAHAPVFIDELDDLATKFADHPKEPYFAVFGANCFAYFVEANATQRRLAIRDLKDKLTFPCAKAVEQLDAMIAEARAKQKAASR